MSLWWRVFVFFTLRSLLFQALWQRHSESGPVGGSEAHNGDRDASDSASSGRRFQWHGGPVVRETMADIRPLWPPWQGQSPSNGWNWEPHRPPQMDRRFLLASCTLFSYSSTSLQQSTVLLQFTTFRPKMNILNAFYLLFLILNKITAKYENKMVLHLWYKNTLSQLLCISFKGFFQITRFLPQKYEQVLPKSVSHSTEEFRTFNTFPK